VGSGSGQLASCADHSRSCVCEGEIVEGRIAKCPRLQQKLSDLPITELAVIVSYSSPLREVKPMASPSCGRESPRTRFGVHPNTPVHDSRCCYAGSCAPCCPLVSNSVVAS
jgi:hypothetical protein